MDFRREERRGERRGGVILILSSGLGMSGGSIYTYAVVIGGLNC